MKKGMKTKTGDNAKKNVTVLTSYHGQEHPQ